MFPLKFAFSSFGRSAGLTLAAIACLVATPRAHAQLYAGESFDYPAGTGLLGQTGGTGFSNAYAGRYGSNTASSASGTLSFGNLSVSGNSAVLPSDFSELRRNFNSFAQPDGSTVYASFLLRPNNAGGLSGIELGNDGGDATTLFVGATSGSYRLETLFGSNGLASVDTGITPVSGQTTLLVLRINFQQGNDTVSLYVNPTPGGLEPITANAIKTDTDFFSNVNFYGLIGDNTSLVDEFRLGGTFADVTPSVPEPSTYLSGILCVGLLFLNRRFREQVLNRFGA